MSSALAYLSTLRRALPYAGEHAPRVQAAITGLERNPQPDLSGPCPNPQAFIYGARRHAAARREAESVLEILLPIRESMPGESEAVARDLAAFPL